MTAASFAERLDLGLAAAGFVVALVVDLGLAALAVDLVTADFEDARFGFWAVVLSDRDLATGFEPLVVARLFDVRPLFALDVVPVVFVDLGLAATRDDLVVVDLAAFDVLVLLALVLVAFDRVDADPRFSDLAVGVLPLVDLVRTVDDFVDVLAVALPVRAPVVVFFLATVACGFVAFAELARLLVGVAELALLPVEAVRLPLLRLWLAFDLAVLLVLVDVDLAAFDFFVVAFERAVVDFVCDFCELAALPFVEVPFLARVPFVLRLVAVPL